MRDPRQLWRDIAHRFAAQSKCRSRQVGCVIVTPDNRLIGQGYNGAPKGSSCDDCPRCNRKNRTSGKALDKAICTHAEANAIGFAAKCGISLEGCTMYTTTRPCLECAKLIVVSGLSAVVYFQDYTDSNFLKIKQIFEKAEITFNYE